MNAYKEYKTIIMAKFNTASAARARQEAVYGGISMYVVYVITSVTLVQWVDESVKVVARLLVRFPHLLTKCSFTFPCKSL